MDFSEKSKIFPGKSWKLPRIGEQFGLGLSGVFIGPSRVSFFLCGNADAKNIIIIIRNSESLYV